ncbi:MAG: HAMP domain-containing histidine kinase [Firmicutes bacterium]|jgi:signal transduction histidine kinase|nr:HAMP domain-containing histidine kinase [Candidatus Fermentithermobacillaceae bacterium]
MQNKIMAGEHMKNRLTQFISTFFGTGLDFRVRLFNVLAMGGTVISMAMALVGIVADAGIGNIMANFISAVLSYALLCYSQRTGRYQLCYMITIVAIFLVLFPVMFFTAGGYHSGMPSFFVFAVTFTILMLEGKKAIVMSIMEILLYLAICVIAFRYPELVKAWDTEQDMLTDVIVGFVSVSAVLGTMLYLHFKLYNEQQKKLDEQNHILERASRAKTEFLSNTSHEMRTPLTVISVNVQTVAEILEDMGEAVRDGEATELLQNAQQEIMRLARMVGGTLTLAAISENTDRQALDFSTLLRSSVEMFSLHLQKRGNTLTSEIAGGLTVFGTADLLAQVVANLLQNAAAYTRHGEVTLRAEKEGHEVLIAVKDTGDGISAELLPHVFERGVSTGGTGFGLYLCKTVVESHGGRIWIESEPGSGTAVMFALPTYEGQFGGEGE